MGSFLSGWYGRRSSRPKDDELPRIGVNDLARRKLLRPGASFEIRWKREGASLRVDATEGGLTLAYKRDGLIRHQSVTIERIACSLGGVRPLFLCCRSTDRGSACVHQSARFRLNKGVAFFA